MRILEQWFGSRRPGASHVEARPSVTAQQDRTRHAIAAMALRDVLKKHAIPTDWIACEVLAGHTRDRVRGLHVRLVVKDGQPELLPYTVSIQRAVLARLIRIDPLSPSWMASLSWRYDVVDDCACPPLPVQRNWEIRQPDRAERGATQGQSEMQPDAATTCRSFGPTDFRATEPMHLR